MSSPPKALGGHLREALGGRLPAYLRRQRWFGGKAQEIAGAEILEVVPLAASPVLFLVMARIRFAEGGVQTYDLPLTVTSGEQAAQSPHPGSAETCLQLPDERGKEAVFFCDALRDPFFPAFALETIAKGRCFRGEQGEVRAWRTSALESMWKPQQGPLPASLVKGEQSNSSVIYGDRLILKFFRRLEEGTNPDLEIGMFLTERARFTHIPPVAGAIEYAREEREPVTLAILQGFVPNRGAAWEYLLDALGPYFERAAGEKLAAPLPQESLLTLSGSRPPPQVEERMGEFLGRARLLGRRTAELHLALASAPDHPDFAPEPFSPAYIGDVSRSMEDLAGRVLGLLGRHRNDLPEPARSEAGELLGLAAQVTQRYRDLRERKLTGMRIRTHGDYHLGQVLYTGDDFVLIDFEGEPARSLLERRIKCSPLRDVAGMVRSFHYAAYSRLLDPRLRVATPAASALLEPWARAWYLWVSAAFLAEYLLACGDAPFLPASRQELAFMLNTYLLDKAIYELGYELNNRPDWVRLPLRGVQQALRDAA